MRISSTASTIIIGRRRSSRGCLVSRFGTLFQNRKIPTIIITIIISRIITFTCSSLPLRHHRNRVLHMTLHHRVNDLPTTPPTPLLLHLTIRTTRQSIVPNLKHRITKPSLCRFIRRQLRNPFLRHTPQTSVQGCHTGTQTLNHGRLWY